MVLHGRQLQATVNTVGEFTTALGDGAIGRILLGPGTYQFTTNMCSSSALCVDRAVTIEAAEAGTVVLNGMGARRVFYITGTGVELIGLNITRGYTNSDDVRSFQHIPLPRWIFTSSILHAGRRALRRRSGNA